MGSDQFENQTTRIMAATSLRTMMMMLLLLILLIQSFVVSAVSSSSNNPASPTNTPPGLINLGNTCYLNSQLQCAYSIPKVRELLITSSDENENDEEQSSSPRKILGELFTDMMQRQSSSSSSMMTAAKIAPRAFCRSLGIPVYEQQDAQEFWKLLLPTLSLPPLLNLYRGELETYIRACDDSGREKKRRETYLDLSLDILADNVHNVEEAIVQTYLTPERLSVAEGNGWRPAKGELPIDAIKGSMLLSGPSQLPSILQLHLKRFQYDWQTGTMSKINKRLPFPLELQLPVDESAATTTSSSWEDDDLPKNNPNSHCRYVLQAVVVHAGEYGAGHYYAYVRPHPSSDAWFRCDDERIEAVSWEEVARDAFGGKYQEEPPETAAIIADQEAPPPAFLVGGQLEQQQRQRSRSGNPLVRFLCSWLHQLGSWIQIGGGRSVGHNSNNKNPYGFGGPTSSVYVLQYVRQCHIDVLFGS
jgi:ubiquitin C-terminal hydrolase